MHPEVISIDPTKQQFLGKRYYLCGPYFQRDGVRLHRVVWQHFNGEIPDGYHIHHKDHDKSNNKPENLELVHGSEHLSAHQKGHTRKIVEWAYPLAAEWHASAEGSAWHRQHYEEFKHRLHEQVERDCTHCGKSHSTNRKNGETSFCSNNCKSAYRRASGVDDVVRTCVVCSSAFLVNKYSKQSTCSRECGSEHSKSTRRKKAENKK